MERWDTVGTASTQEGDTMKTRVFLTAVVAAVLFNSTPAQADFARDIALVQRGEITIEEAVERAVAARESTESIVVASTGLGTDLTRLAAALLRAGVGAGSVRAALLHVGVDAATIGKVVTVAQARFSRTIALVQRGQLSLEEAVERAVAAGESVEAIVVTGTGVGIDFTRLSAALLRADTDAASVKAALVRVGVDPAKADKIVTVAQARFSRTLALVQRGRITLEEAVERAVAAGERIEAIVGLANLAGIDLIQLSAALLRAGADTNSVKAALVRVGVDPATVNNVVIVAQAQFASSSAAATTVVTPPTVVVGVTGAGAGAGGGASPF